MGDLIEALIQFVAAIWGTDSDMRDNSAFGESPAERRDRRHVGWVCGGTILLNEVAVAIDMFEVDHDRLPNTLEELIPATNGLGVWPRPANRDQLKPDPQ